MVYLHESEYLKVFCHHDGIHIEIYVERCSSGSCRRLYHGRVCECTGLWSRPRPSIRSCPAVLDAYDLGPCSCQPSSVSRFPHHVDVLDEDVVPVVVRVRTRSFLWRWVCPFRWGWETWIDEEGISSSVAELLTVPVSGLLIAEITAVVTLACLAGFGVLQSTSCTLYKELRPLGNRGTSDASPGNLTGLMFKAAVTVALSSVLGTLWKR